MQSFAYELVTELEARGIRGVRWEDSVRNDLLFSKVCEGIYANDFLLAEVTTPNLNVLLEIGYALAVGRQPLLLQDKNRKSWTRDLLTTLESCFIPLAKTYMNTYLVGGPVLPSLLNPIGAYRS